MAADVQLYSVVPYKCVSILVEGTENMLALLTSRHSRLDFEFVNKADAFSTRSFNLYTHKY